jgi:hypothetical protein
VDILTGDEIISDSYDLKEVDDAVYEVDCAMITLGAVEVSMYSSDNRDSEQDLADTSIQTLVPTHLQRKPKKVSRMALCRSTM